MVMFLNEKDSHNFMVNYALTVSKGMCWSGYR